jgi:hypothetical protein
MPSWKFLQLYGAVECNPGDFNGDGQVDLAFGSTSSIGTMSDWNAIAGENSTIGQEMATKQLLTEAA